MLKKSYTVYKTIDQGFLELIGATGLIYLLSQAVIQLRKQLNGNICDYLVIMLTPLVVLIIQAI